MEQNAVNQILNEVAIYGGLPMRRGNIIILATEHMGENADSHFGAQWFALHGPAVGLAPFTLQDAREIMGGACTRCGSSAEALLPGSDICGACADEMEEDAAVHLSTFEGDDLERWAATP